MSVETRVPDSIAELTELSGVVGDIDNTIASADGTFLTSSTNGASVLRVTFPTPSGTPNTGELQKFRIQVRKDSTGGNDPGADIELYENGSLVSTVSSHTVTSSSSQIIEGTWDAVNLANSNGSGVECRVVQTSGHTGNPGNRRFVEIDEVEWVVDFSASQVVTVGIVSEADSNLAGVAEKSVQAGLVLETGEALAPVKIVPVGIPAESSVSLVAGSLKAALVGIPSETSVSLAALANKSVQAGLTSETSQALKLEGSLIVVVGLAAESSSVSPVKADRRVSVGLPSGASSALAALAERIHSAGLASDISSALATGHSKSAIAGIALESSLAQSVLHARGINIGIPSGVNTSLPVSVRRGFTVGIPNEISGALLLGGPVPVGLAQETDTAPSVSPIKETSRLWYVYDQGRQERYKTDGNKII